MSVTEKSVIKSLEVHVDHHIYTDQLRSSIHVCSQKHTRFACVRVCVYTDDNNSTNSNENTEAMRREVDRQEDNQQEQDGE